MKKMTLTIGISAYNEAHNIVELLGQLTEQVQKTYKLEKIVVHSDGSSDSTAALVKKARLKKVTLVDHRTRLGKAVRLNQIVAETKTSILVLLDADVVITDTLFIEKLIGPIRENIADLTSGKVIALPPQNTVQRMLQSSMQFKTDVFETIKNGDNVYTCHGRSRALSHALYTQFKFQDSDNEDAFSFFIAKKLGFKYAYVSEALLYYKLPLTFADHIKQSVRYYTSKPSLVNTFGEHMVAKAYKIPHNKVVPILVKVLLTDPYFVLYVLVHTVIWIKSKFSTPVAHTWNVATSSKLLARKTQRAQL